jgi:hypothetical protein
MKTCPMKTRISTPHRNGAEQPLFGGAPAGSDSIRTAVLGSSSAALCGSTWAVLSGIGFGTEFTSTNDSDGQKIQLRVTCARRHRALDGHSRQPGRRESANRGHLRNDEVESRTVPAACASGIGPQRCPRRTSSPQPRRFRLPASPPSPTPPKSHGRTSSAGTEPPGRYNKPARLHLFSSARL